MSLIRQVVGKPVQYRMCHIVVRYMGPDLLCEVDGLELANFFINSYAAIAGGKRYIDQQIREQEQKK